MRRWLHCLLVALLCLTLFVDSARACWYLRQRSRRAAACPPPAIPAQPCCPPGQFVGGWAAAAWSTPSCGDMVVVRDVPRGMAWHGGVSGHVVFDRPVAETAVIHDHAGCACGADAGWHEGHLGHVIEHGVISHGVISHGVISHGVIEHGTVVDATGDATGGQASRVVEHGATIVTEVAPRPADTVRRPAADTAPAAETPLALPPQRATAIVPQATAPQAAAALPDLIAPTSGQTPAKPVAPVAADGTQSVVVDPSVVAKPAVAAPAAEPAVAEPKMKAAPAAADAPEIGEPEEAEKPAKGEPEEADEPMVEEPADGDAPAAESDEEMTDEKPEAPAGDDDAEEAGEKPAARSRGRTRGEADMADPIAEPAPVPKKPRAANLFDEIDDDAEPAATEPGDDAAEPEMVEEPGDDTAPGDDDAEPEMVEDPADAPADDDAPKPTTKDADGAEPAAEPGDDEPAEEAAEPEMAEEPGDDSEPADDAPAEEAAEPEMTEEPADDESGDDQPGDDDEPAADGEPKRRPQESDADAADAAAFNAPAEPMRRWVDSSGAHQTRGWLVEATTTHVRILKVNGRFTTVKLDTLSAADRDYVADVVVRMAAQRRAAPPRIDTAGL